MDDGVLGILGFVLIFVALELAALRFGHDSRSILRELPLPGDAVIRIPPGAGRRLRALLTSETLGNGAWPTRPMPSCAPTAVTRAKRFRRPFRPYIASDVYAYSRFDLAAVGK